ncbi:hypothetical protein PUN28_002800 [Cardiocondyla obscurior]|uniref:Uncharacterized protein n=1 Tax=Cardiocondyla obscurior TaxID=286306 RepID=A0AAW2GWC1_9HYME
MEFNFRECRRKKKVTVLFIRSQHWLTSEGNWIIARWRRCRKASSQARRLRNNRPVWEPICGDDTIPCGNRKLCKAKKEISERCKAKVGMMEMTNCRLYRRIVADCNGERLNSELSVVRSLIIARRCLLAVSFVC